MNFAEMFSTTGGMLFYGGIIGAAVSVVLGLIFAIGFAGAKRRLERKLDSEYDGRK